MIPGARVPVGYRGFTRRRRCHHHMREGLLLRASELLRHREQRLVVVPSQNERLSINGLYKNSESAALLPPLVADLRDLVDCRVREGCFPPLRIDLRSQRAGGSKRRPGRVAEQALACSAV